MQCAPHSRLRAFGSLSARFVPVAGSSWHLRFGGCEARLLRQFVPAESRLHYSRWARSGEFAQSSRSRRAQKPGFLTKLGVKMPELSQKPGFEDAWADS